MFRRTGKEGIITEKTPKALIQGSPHVPDPRACQLCPLQGSVTTARPPLEGKHTREQPLDKLGSWAGATSGAFGSLAPGASQLVSRAVGRLAGLLL